jgi:tetratricopeptide (TPR) repeat protein
MTDKRLKDLLQQADQAAGRPEMAAVNLAERIRQLDRRRRGMKTAAQTAAAAVLMMGLGLAFWSDIKPTTVTSNQDRNNTVAVNEDQAGAPGVKVYTEAEVTQLKVEIAQLQGEADLRLKIIKDLLEIQRRQAVLVSLEEQLAAIPDPLAEVRRQVEQAAYRIVYQADLKYKQADSKESAIEDYERVLRLYPQTRWAMVAQAKLSEIRFDQKGNIL